MLRTALLKLGAFGVASGGPGERRGRRAPRHEAALARQGQALLKISGARLDQGARAARAARGRGPARRREQLVDAHARRVRAVVRRAAAVHVRCRRRDRIQRARWPPARRRRAAMRWPCTPGSRAARGCATAWRASGVVPAARGGARRRRAAEPERRAVAVRQPASAGWGLPPLPATGHPAEQAVARRADRRPDQHHAGDERPAGRRMGGDRAQHPRDHGAGLPVRRAGLVRAAKRADRRAAGARTGLDRRNAAPRADGDARSGEAARGGHRERSARRRSICPASISRSTPRTMPCRPTSRR